MAEPFPRASPGVPSMAMALRLGAGPAKAAPTRRSARSIFPAAHVAGKNDPDSFRLTPETRKGVPLPGPFPGGRGTKVPGQLPASIGVPAIRLAAKRLRRRRGRCGGRTGGPGQLPASIGSACCPARRLAALPAGAFGAVSPRLPCGKGDVCERRRGRKKRAKRSGSGQNSVSDSEQRILGTMTDAPNASGVWSAEAMP